MIKPEQLKNIHLLMLDVDGVLTDGTLSYTANGEELKQFNVKDGLGIRLCLFHGIDIAICTARDSKPLAKRVTDLGIKHFYPGCSNKLAVFDQLLEKCSLKASQVAYVGDDMLDLPVMKKVGLSITVADGYHLVKQSADWIATLPGGKGAVREICDELVAAQMSLEQAYAELLAADAEKHHLTTA